VTGPRRPNLLMVAETRQGKGESGQAGRAICSSRFVSSVAASSLLLGPQEMTGERIWASPPAQRSPRPVRPRWSAQRTRWRLDPTPLTSTRSLRGSDSHAYDDVTPRHPPLLLSGVHHIKEQQSNSSSFSPHHDHSFNHVIPPICDPNNHEDCGTCLPIPHPPCIELTTYDLVTAPSILDDSPSPKAWAWNTSLR
jgi:hypothetical protein